MKKPIMIASLALTALLSGCGANITNVEVPKEIQHLSIEKGNTIEIALSYAVDKENATKEDIDKAVEKANFTWTVADDKVATFENNILTAKEKGETQIKVVSEDKKYNTTFDVSVIVSVTDFTLKNTATVFAGETLNILEKVTPENANTEQIVYASLNPEIATIDGKGEVKGVSKGDCTIVATKGDIKKETTLSVKIAATAVTIEKTEGIIATGGSYTLKPTLSPADSETETFTYTSSDESVATVSDKGIIKGKKDGTATITATSEKGLTATYTITIKAKAATQSGSNGTAATQGGGAAATQGGGSVAPPPANEPVAPAPEPPAPAPVEPPPFDGGFVGPGDGSGSMDGGF